MIMAAVVMIAVGGTAMVCGATWNPEVEINHPAFIVGVGAASFVCGVVTVIAMALSTL